jgi:endonuclease/exonuclease/phosphatase family metal-dependent hydrolase
MSKTTIRILSFNIRYGTAPDGDRSWDHRRHLVLERIRDNHPDVIALQECLWFQLEYLLESLGSEFDHYFAGRDDGQLGGEATPILVRKDRFTTLNVEHFWVSPQSHIPGSRGWDACFPRVTTCVYLEEKKGSSKWRTVVFNTHLDHGGRTSRSEAIRMIRSRVEFVRDDVPLLICGDFNEARKRSSLYRELMAPSSYGKTWLRDSFDDAGEVSKASGSCHDFRGNTSPSWQIDWILLRGPCKCTKCWIDKTHTGSDYYPSDHFPVGAEIVLQ